MRSSFFCPKGKKAEGWSPPQELEVSPRSGLYLLVWVKEFYSDYPKKEQSCDILEILAGLPGLFNRPNVAKAVLQTASSFIQWASQPFPPDIQNIIVSKPLELESWNLTEFLPHIMCHMSRVTCDLSHVTCHLSHVKTKKNK